MPDLSLAADTLRRAIAARRDHPAIAAIFSLDGGIVIFDRPTRACNCAALRALLDDWLRAAPLILPDACITRLDLIERTAILLLNQPPCRWG